MCVAVGVAASIAAGVLWGVGVSRRQPFGGFVHVEHTGGAAPVSVPAPHERLNQPGALLSRPGYARPFVQAADYAKLIADSTFRGDRVRPT